MLSRTALEMILCALGPSDRRMALPPKGSIRPVVSRHHTPRSITFIKPLVEYVSWPSWMISPASNFPASISGMIWSNGTVTVLIAGLKIFSARYAVVSVPGTAT